MAKSAKTRGRSTATKASAAKQRRGSKTTVRAAARTRRGGETAAQELRVPVIVLTAHGVVFFGDFSGETNWDSVILRNAQPADVADIGRLAAVGPTHLRPFDEIEVVVLKDPVAFVYVSPDAVTRWRTVKEIVEHPAPKPTRWNGASILIRLANEIRGPNREVVKTMTPDDPPALPPDTFDGISVDEIEAELRKLAGSALDEADVEVAFHSIKDRKQVEFDAELASDADSSTGGDED